MAASFFDLPAEVRNLIYELVFDIKYELSYKRMQLWTHRPKHLAILRTCRQTNLEAGSLFYKKFFPQYEYQAVSFRDLHDFTKKLPHQYRRQCKAKLRLLIPDGASLLMQLGLKLTAKWLPWEWETPKPERSAAASAATVSAKLRGDCFLLTYFRAPGDFGGYDRITMIGHLGRLDWEGSSRLKICYKPPQAHPPVHAPKDGSRPTRILPWMPRKHVDVLQQYTHGANQEDRFLFDALFPDLFPNV